MLRLYLVGGALLCTLSPADAAPPASIEWSAPAACPEMQVLRVRVEELVALSAQGWPPAYSVQVEISQSGERWRLVLRFTGAGADPEEPARSVEGESCEALVEAAALLIAMDLGAALEEAAEVASPQNETDLPPRRPSEPAPAPGEPLAVLGVVAAAGDLGSLPSPAAGGALRASVGRQRWSVEVALVGWPGRRAEAGGEIDGGADVWAYWAEPGACVDPLGWAWPVRGCTGVELGWMAGRGVAVDTAQRTGAVWIAPQASVALGMPLSAHLSVELRAGAAIPLVRPQFQLGDGSFLHQPGRVVGRLFLGVGWRIR